MQAAFRRAEAAHPREQEPKAEQVRNLGLLEKDEESAAFLKKEEGSGGLFKLYNKHV